MSLVPDWLIICWLVAANSNNLHQLFLKLWWFLNFKICGFWSVKICKLHSTRTSVSVASRWHENSLRMWRWCLLSRRALLMQVFGMCHNELISFSLKVISDRQLKRLSRLQPYWQKERLPVSVGTCSACLSQLPVIFLSVSPLSFYESQSLSRKCSCRCLSFVAFMLE